LKFGRYFVSSETQMENGNKYNIKMFIQAKRLTLMADSKSRLTKYEYVNHIHYQLKYVDS